MIVPEVWVSSGMIASDTPVGRAFFPVLEGRSCFFPCAFLELVRWRVASLRHRWIMSESPGGKPPPSGADPGGTGRAGASQHPLTSPLSSSVAASFRGPATLN